MTDLQKLYKEMKEEPSVQYKTKNDLVLIVDGLNSFIRCFAAIPTMNDDGEHIGGVAGFLKSIGLALRTFKPSRCIIAFDGKGGSQRRRKIYPEYKENRKHMTRLNRTYGFDTVNDESKSMEKQLILLARLLKCLPITVMAPNHVEADDVIAYTAQLIEKRDGKAIIMSTDKDFLQIVSNAISVWNPITKKMYNPASVVDEYNIHPNNFVFYRMMDGDVTDNIPGIKGVGHKSLVKKYPKLSEAQPLSITEIIDYAGRQKGKIFERISNSKEILERNYELMRLDEVLMSGETKLQIVDKVDSDELSYHKMEFIKLISANNMTTAFGKDYHTWLLTTFQPLMRVFDER